MKIKSLYIKLSYIPLLFAAYSAHAVIDDDAATVLLETSCTKAGTYLDNCFENIATLQDWITNTRIRSVEAPLLIDIGPGTFKTTQFDCHDSGYITLRGSGRKHTKIKGNGGYTISLLPECNLDVLDLTIEDKDGQSLGAIGIGSTITGQPGRTTWSNVDVIAKTYGWTEGGCSNSKHYWFGSTITVTTGPSFLAIARGYSTCSESWFYGSEITAKATDVSNEAAAIITKGGGAEVHVYGSSIRAIAEPGITLQPAAKGNSAGTVKGLVAVSVGPQDEVHIHGTGIDVISAEPNDTAAILGWNDSFVHASESAYALKTGTGGNITRIMKYDNADIRAPHQWHASTTPPNITSVDGSDTVVETDCSETNCLNVGDQPHVLVYNSSCTGAGGSWFDSTTGECRGVNSKTFIDRSGSTPVMYISENTCAGSGGPWIGLDGICRL